MDWRDFEPNTDLLFHEGLHGAIVNETVNIAQHAELKIGIFPVINLEWIQKFIEIRQVVAAQTKQSKSYPA